MSRRTSAHPRPADSIIRRMLGVTGPATPVELHQRADFYRLPNVQKTRSYNTLSAGSMHRVICACDAASAIDRVAPGIQRDVVLVVRAMNRPFDTDAQVVAKMRAELRAECASRLAAFEAADSCAESLEAYGADRETLAEASQLREHCRAQRWPEWTDDLRGPWGAMPHAVLTELAGGRLLGHRSRAASIGRSKPSFTSCWRGPYEWLHDRWQRIYRDGLRMLDEAKTV